MTYKRGQVEWALWRAFTLARSPGDGPPSIFRTRVKRLLDLDREFDTSEMEVPPTCAFAFVEPSDGGSGFETQYAPFDVFCLAIGLDLLDVGFKQGEIVLVQIGDCLGVMRSQLGFWDLVHPGADHLAENLATGLASHRVSNHPNGVLGFDEAEGHVHSGSKIPMPGKVGPAPDGANA